MGVITDLSEDAPLLLDLDVRRVQGQPLPMLFAEDQPEIYRDMRTALEDAAMIIRERTLTPSQRQRIPVRVSLEVLRDTGELRWVVWRHCGERPFGARRAVSGLRMKQFDRSGM